MFTDKDKEQAKNLGIEQATITAQIERFKNGFPKLNISRAANVGDGIVKFSDEELQKLALDFDKIENTKIVKFVPASGAATRMMKELFEYADQDKTSAAIEKLMANIEKFAFYNDLKASSIDTTDGKATVEAILRTPLNYGLYPKGVIKFHSYEQGARTPIQEHLVEAELYGKTLDSATAYIHFTISADHKTLFENCVESSLENFEKEYGVKFNISYSTQKKSTDTIAVDLENQAFRKSSGELLFRPAGHGALIENLNEIDADLIFIKTIDNVQPDRTKTEGITYKKALANLALDLKCKADEYIKAIDNNTAEPQEVINFVEGKLNYHLGSSTNFEQLRSILDRPLRICGMVKNEGEPGGGPFWVVNQDGESQALQILESAQIPQEKMDELMTSASHFNPVDLVCAVKRYDGTKYNLKEFVDENTGFISQKSFEGKDLKAMELPGLWNGAMASWNTIFVEVPIVTFSPVKTLVDLLREEHQ